MKTQLCLVLIKEEIKSRYFFNHLRKVGLDDAFFQSDLGDCILELLNKAPSEHSREQYYACLVKYSENLFRDDDSALYQAAEMISEDLERIC